MLPFLSWSINSVTFLPKDFKTCPNSAKAGGLIQRLDFLIRLAIIKQIKFYAVDQRKNKTLRGEVGRGEKTAGKRTFPRGKKEPGSGGGLGSRSGRFERGNIGHRRKVRRFRSE